MKLWVELWTWNRLPQLCDSCGGYLAPCTAGHLSSAGQLITIASSSTSPPVFHDPATSASPWAGASYLFLGLFATLIAMAWYLVVLVRRWCWVRRVAAGNTRRPDVTSIPPP